MRLASGEGDLDDLVTLGITGAGLGAGALPPGKGKPNINPPSSGSGGLGGDGNVRPWKDGAYHGPKPKYNNPGHHDPSSGKFRGGGSKTSPLPDDAQEVYKKAIPTPDGRTWYGKNSDGEIYRYQVDREGFVHFNGRENSERRLKVPSYIRKRLRY